MYNTIISNQEKINWLRLARSKNIGSVTFNNIISLYKTASNAIKFLPDMIKKNNANIVLSSEKSAINELEKTKKFGGDIILKCESDYPVNLKYIKNAPPVISVIGNLQLLNHNKKFAIVGARNASINSCKLAYNIAKNLSNHEYAIVSGLALGIDAYAHMGSVKHNPIAVIGGGINTIYPNENKKLYQQIIEQGIIISEFPIDVAPKAHHFPIRNKIIAGISDGLLVAEATQKSGSMITANFANDFGREVFAIPGSPLDPRNKGNNNLIRNGANICESANDILDVMNNIKKNNNSLFENSYSNEIERDIELYSDNEINEIKKSILDNISYDFININSLITILGVRLDLLLTALLELELSNIITRDFMGNISKKFNNNNN